MVIHFAISSELVRCRECSWIDLSQTYAEAGRQASCDVESALGNVPQMILNSVSREIANVSQNVRENSETSSPALALDTIVA